MSDLLAVSYAKDSKIQAQRLFSQACDALTRIKGVNANDRAEEDGHQNCSIELKK